MPWQKIKLVISLVKYICATPLEKRNICAAKKIDLRVEAWI
jgi:hypothetical protein